MVTAQPWFHRLARAGFATKAVVYALVGGLAVAWAIGAGGKVTSSQGALKTVAQQPYGSVMLALIAIGLVGYALWRGVQAIFNSEGQPNSAKGWLVRTGYAISGIVHLAIALLAVQLILGKSGNGGATKTWLHALLRSGIGRVVVFGIGVGVIGVGIAQIKRAYDGLFRDRLATSEMSPVERRSVIWLGRVGLLSRGIIFPIIGFVLVRAALGKGGIAKVGVDGALQTLAAQPHGQLLLLLVAPGLIAYGGYMMAWARYRRTP